jgi:ADP-heptose:LPS heptosyltransferase
MGDVICCIPAYRALKQKYPGHLIIFATTKPYDDLLRHCGEIDAVYGMPAGVPFPQAKAAWLVDRHYEPHTSDERGQGGQKLHLARVFLKDCDLPLADWQPHFSIPAGEKEAVVRQFNFQPGEIIIAIHTGRTWPVKELPEARWQEIVDGLKKIRPGRILHFCSPAKFGNQDLPVHSLQGVQTMPPGLPLATIAAVLSMSRILIGIDSGLLHLAGAVGTPVVGIFGPTNPAYYLPLNSSSHAISHALPCSFCHHERPIQHWQTGCPHNIQCMREISAAQVIAAANHVHSL